MVIDLCRGSSYLIIGLILLYVSGCNDSSPRDGHMAVGHCEKLLLPTVLAKPAPKPDVGDIGFGAAAIQNDMLIVGAHKWGTGASVIYKRAGTAWTFQQRLTASTGWAIDHFGAGIIDNDTIVVGAPGKNAPEPKTGAAYVFERVGLKWKETQILFASNSSRDAAFGARRAIAGGTLIVSATSAYGRTKFSKSGAVYVFYKCGKKWHEKQKLFCKSGPCGSGGFGKALALSEGTLLVGSVTEYGKGSKSGAAYVYTRQGTSWVEQQRLTPKDLQSGDFFGISASLFRDIAAVGSWGEDTRGKWAGALYLFQRTGTKWAQTHKLTASDHKPNWGFGYEVAMKNNILLIGAPGDDTQGYMAGAVYVLYLDTGGWKEQYKLLPPKGTAQGQFGSGLSFDGKTVAISAFGAAYTAPVVIKGAADAGSPDLGPDTGPPWPDPCIDQGPDKTIPDLSVSVDQVVEKDAGIPDSQLPLPDTGSTEVEQEGGCSCALEGKPPSSPLMPFFGLTILLLLWRRAKNRRRVKL